MDQFRAIQMGGFTIDGMTLEQFAQRPVPAVLVGWKDDSIFLDMAIDGVWTRFARVAVQTTVPTDNPNRGVVGTVRINNEITVLWEGRPLFTIGRDRTVRMHPRPQSLLAGDE